MTSRNIRLDTVQSAPTEERVIVFDRLGSGHVYSLGLSGESLLLDRSHIYEETWDELRYLRHYAVCVHGCHIYFLGGYDMKKHVVTNKARRYNTLLDLWENLPPMLHPRCCCDAVYYNRRIYVTGGERSDGDCTRNCEAFFIPAWMWERVGQIPSRRKHHRVVSDGSTVFLHGGEGGALFHCNARLFDHFIWTSVGHGERAMHDKSSKTVICRSRHMIEVHDGKIYCLGGILWSRIENPKPDEPVPINRLSSHDTRRKLTGNSGSSITEHSMVLQVTSDRQFLSTQAEDAVFKSLSTGGVNSAKEKAVFLKNINQKMAKEAILNRYKNKHKTGIKSAIESKSKALTMKIPAPQVFEHGDNQKQLHGQNKITHTSRPETYNNPTTTSSDKIKNSKLMTRKPSPRLAKIKGNMLLPSDKMIKAHSSPNPGTGEARDARDGSHSMDALDHRRPTSAPTYLPAINLDRSLTDTRKPGKVSKDPMAVSGGVVAFTPMSGTQDIRVTSAALHTLPCMKHPRFSAASIVIGSNLYVIGGTGSDGKLVPTVELFDLKEHTWREHGLLTNCTMSNVVAFKMTFTTDRFTKKDSHVLLRQAKYHCVLCM